MAQSPLSVLQKYWSHDSFRPLQEEIIQSVLNGNDTLALLPTGGGKSICFQVPGLIKDGICVVISPLIALMKDQVEHLAAKNIPAVSIHSGLYYKELDLELDRCVQGIYKFLYLSPERLNSEIVQERFSRMQINLIAVDEAHCISQWGYDFRPPYLQIADIRPLCPDTPILALTATATPAVVKDIQEKLAFKNGVVFQQSFQRKNLAYVVLNEEDKASKLLEIARNVQGSGVVYVRNRKLAKDYAGLLSKNGISSTFYHAGLSHADRTSRQDEWMRSQTRTIVSTNAFGMGIDKPDVRFVVHMDLPDSLEAYFQEAGRAGRDGHKSYAVLLYANSDKIDLLHDFEISFPAADEIRRVYQALGSYFQIALGSGLGMSYDFDLMDFTKNYGFEYLRTHHCLKQLEQAGWISMSDAVFMAPTVFFCIDRESLYDFQLKNSKYDLIIKTLLRVGEGIFQHPVRLDERRLANFIKIKEEELKAHLIALHKEGVLSYHPRKDKPQLTFLENRTDPRNLNLDEKTMLQRKERQHARIQKAIAYAEENKICRSIQLLSYFGETSAEKCGICDVCLGRNVEHVKPEDYDRYKSKILSMLIKESITEEQIFQSFHPKHATRLAKILEFMLDEGLIKRDDSGNMLVNNA